ncbi:MAG TPA: RNA-binding protein [Vicinamibacteria bacterium]|jgi:RNA recognition motif-containing protein
MSRIFVGNCSFNVTEDELRSLFATYGEVSSVSVITDRDTGRPRGFAFVEMSDDAAAQAAIRGVNGTELGGRTLNVNEARPKNFGGGGGGGGERRGGGGGGGGRGGARRW